MRAKEVLLLAGIPFVGAVSGAFRPDPHYTGRLAALLFSFALIAAHIFTFNDWAGLPTDRLNKYRLPLNAALVSPFGLFFFSFALLAAGLLFALLLSLPVFLTGCAIGLLSFLYSGRQVFLKGTALASSLAHLLAGTFYYLFGVLLFNRLNGAGALTGLYFGILYAAGHLNHEVLDLEGDARAGYATNAVRFGPGRMLSASLGVLAFSNIYLLTLCALGLLPYALFAASFLVFLVYAYFFSSVRDRDLQRLLRLRGYRRGLYVSLGAAWVVISLLRLRPR